MAEFAVSMDERRSVTLQILADEVVAWYCARAAAR
jgi:hypothetical protein